MPTLRLCRFNSQVGWHFDSWHLHSDVVKNQGLSKKPPGREPSVLACPARDESEQVENKKMVEGRRFRRMEQCPDTDIENEENGFITEAIRDPFAPENAQNARIEIGNVRSEAVGNINIFGTIIREECRRFKNFATDEIAASEAPVHLGWAVLSGAWNLCVASLMKSLPTVEGSTANVLYSRMQTTISNTLTLGGEPPGTVSRGTLSVCLDRMVDSAHELSLRFTTSSPGGDSGGRTQSILSNLAASIARVERMLQGPSPRRPAGIARSEAILLDWFYDSDNVARSQFLQQFFGIPTPARSELLGRQFYTSMLDEFGKVLAERTTSDATRNMHRRRSPNSRMLPDHNLFMIRGARAR